ncbi:MAG: PIN domain-containing protein [Thermomicrobiales bacterium]
MPYILDSDVVIYYLNESVDSERHVNRLMLEGIAISTITLMEVLAGISTVQIRRKLMPASRI